MINHFEFYKLYTVIGLHTKGTYDCIKYNFANRLKEDNFLRHRHKFFFERFARNMADETYAINYIVANYFNNVNWIGNFHKDNYNSWWSFNEGIEYKIAEGVKKYWTNGIESVITSIEERFTTQDDTDLLFFMTLNVILNNALMNEMDKKFDGNILYENFRKKLTIFSPFVEKYFKLDRPKLLTIVQQNLQPKRETA